MLLAADPKSSIDVVVARTGGRGVVKGIAGSDRYRTRVEYLERKDEAAEGDLVVTSGLGGFFPRDLPVGKIVKVDKRGFGLYQEVEVQPVVDFGKLRDVLVVVPREAQPDGPTPEAIAPPGVPEKGEVSAQRAIVMVLAVWVGLIVTSSLQALSPWRIPTPEVALLVVLYLGLGGRGTAPGQLGVALVIGYLADLFAGSPKGLESLTLGVAMLLARAAAPASMSPRRGTRW